MPDLILNFVVSSPSFYFVSFKLANSSEELTLCIAGIVFHSSIKRTSQVVPFLPSGAWSRLWSYQNQEPMDFAPGSSVPAYKELLENLNSQIDCHFGFADNSTFVPTVSALAFDTDNLFHDIQDDANKLSKTPFDDIIGISGENTSHITGQTSTAQIVNWLLNEINVDEEQLCFCDEIPTEDITVSQSEIFNLDIVHGTLTILPNVTLTINSDVEFTPVSRIIIENGGRLIVNGATLTKCGDQNSSRWQGIKLGTDINSAVPGSSAQAVIEMKNNAIIEYAKIGILDLTTTFPPIGTLGIQVESAPGIILMEPMTEIRYCKTGIYFGPTSVQLGSVGSIASENSVINGVNITNNNLGIHCNRNHGLQLEGNVFEDNGDGILLVNSHITARNNTFINGIGIRIEGTVPSFFGSTITDNDHFDAVGIHLSSQTNSTPNDIKGNQFYSNFIGISGNGIGDFDIAQNDMLDCWYGTRMENTGLNISNSIYDNAFYGSISGGCTVSYENSIQYLTNCFAGSQYADIDFINGSIFPSQGNDQLSAGNCFSDALRFSVGSNVNEIVYYTKDGFSNPSNCKNPGTGNFQENLSIAEASESCGTNGLFGNLDPNLVDCVIPIGITLQNEMIDDLWAEIANVHNDSTLTQWEKDWLITKFKTCILDIINAQAIVALDDDRLSDAIQLFSSQNDFNQQIMAYGLLVNYGDITGSIQYLNSLNPIEPEEQDFIQTQQIYLDYLQDPSNYVLSNVDSSYIRSVGEQKTTLAGFSRAIYYVLTGIRIPIDIDTTYIHASTRSSKLETKVEMSISPLNLYPTPSLNDILNIELLSEEKIETIDIIDMYGNQYKAIRRNSKQLDISLLSKGLYFLNIKTETGKLFSGKFVKL